MSTHEIDLCLIVRIPQPARLTPGPATTEAIGHSRSQLLPPVVDPSRGTIDLLLFGVVRNVARELSRRHGATARHEGAWHAATPTMTSGSIEDALSVRAAVRALPHTDREVLLLSIYHGCSPHEIAQALGLHGVTVRVRLHRARRRLRRILVSPDPASTSRPLKEHES